jgi:hypothetical protein
MSETYPVTVAVTLRDGSVEHVRVGTAVRQGEGFSLKLGELSLGPAEVRTEAPRARSSASGGGGGMGDGMVFPPYGRSKGLPIAGASTQDLEFYANGARRTLADPGKARFHDKERGLLATIEAELARQRGDGGGGGFGNEEEPPPPGDEDAPF